MVYFSSSRCSSQVEFVEELFPGEIPLTSIFRDWSVEGPGNVWTYSLSRYAMVEALEVEFPVGDTYKFDVELYNNAVDFRFDDLFATVTVRRVFSYRGDRGTGGGEGGDGGGL